MDLLGFEAVSRVIEASLSSQGYVPSEEARAANLVIVVYWGTTIVPDDVNPKDTRDLHVANREAEADQDAEIDAKSANILGYTDEIFRTGPHDPSSRTLQDEVERDRYYVVLLAYDNRAARQFGVHKLLWETRFSIPEPGNDFEKSFPLMTRIAAKYFGRDSHGLVHHQLGEGRVEIGTPESLGTLPEK